MAAAWTSKGRLQYFAMFLLRTSIVLRSALLQSLDQVLCEIANHELCHLDVQLIASASNASAAFFGLQAMLALAVGSSVNQGIKCRYFAEILDIAAEVLFAISAT
jgi:hypothetical protein